MLRAASGDAFRSAEDVEAILLPSGIQSSSVESKPRGPLLGQEKQGEDGGRPLFDKTVSHICTVSVDLVQKSVAVAEEVGAAATTLHEAVKETATPAGATRIARSTWAKVKSDVEVSAHASHDMLVLWLCPAHFKALDIGTQYRHCWVLFNPLYWILFLPLIPCIVAGKWLHSLWGQGDMMRPDETIEESRVRLHWIYCLDGPIAGAALLDLVDVLFDLPLYTQRKFKNSLISWLMTLIVTSAYVVANSYFLDVMRRRSLVGVRLVIVYQTVFAVGLLNMLVAVCCFASTRSTCPSLQVRVQEQQPLLERRACCFVVDGRARFTTRPLDGTVSTSLKHGLSLLRGLRAW